MKYFDILHFVLYKMYYRDDPKNLAPFFINSLWIGLCEFFWVMSLLGVIELSTGRFIFNPAGNLVIFFGIMLGFGVVNYIFVSIGNRKEIIKNKYQLSKGKIQLFSALFLLTLISGFILLGIITIELNKTFPVQMDNY